MASFTLYIPTLLKNEGDYQQNPKDNGNYNSKGELVGTRWGISAKTLERWQNWPPTAFQMKTLAKATALQIHESWFWNAMRANQINNQQLAELIVDHAINSSPKRAAIILQKTLNSRYNKRLVVDGIVGSKTIQAVNSVNADDLYRYYWIARKQYYNSLNNPFFIDGWLNRLKIIAGIHGKDVKKFISDNKIIITAMEIAAFAALGYIIIKKRANV